MSDLDTRTHDAVRAAMAKAPPWLAAKGPLLLIRAGSHAAGVALASSDVDLRGVAIAPRSSYLGFAHKFERFVTDAPDCEVSDLRIFMHEACEGHPNALQVLFCHDDDVVLKSPVGDFLRTIREWFLSTRMLKPYLGYVKSMTTQVCKAERMWSITADRSRFTEEKLAELAKSTMHAKRLFRSVREVLEGEKLQVRRPDAEELLRIRAARSIHSMRICCEEIEGGIQDLWDMAKKSSLPERPDLDELDHVCMELIERNLAK